MSKLSKVHQEACNDQLLKKFKFETEQKTLKNKHIK